MKDLLEKYNLPKKVKIQIDKAKEGGFVVEFPDLPGCFTQVEDLSQLNDNVTDAVLTYFDVPRKESYKIIYVPETKPSIQSVPERFDLFVSA